MQILNWWWGQDSKYSISESKGPWSSGHTVEAMSGVAWGGEVGVDFMKDITEQVPCDLGLER